MTNLWILIKNNFNIMLGNFQGKKKRKSSLVATMLLIFLFTSILITYSYQAWIMFNQFAPLGLSKMIMFHSLTVTTTVVVTIGVMRISINANTTDEWFLLSSPIRKRDIIASKLLNRYLFDILFVALMVLPFVVIYLIKVEFTAMVLALGVALTLLLPLLSVGISNILGYVVSVMFNKFRCASLLKSLISVFIFIMVYGMLLIKTSSYGLVEVSNMEEFFADRPISNLLLKFLLEPSFGVVLLTLLLTVVPFVIGAIFYGVNFGKQSIGYHTTNKVLKFGKGKGVLGSMFIKELNSYATTPAFVANTIIGPILMVGFAILMVTSGENRGIGVLMLLIPEELIAGLFAILLSLFASMTVISACTISLEGKSLWLLKSTPVNEKHLFLAKALLQMVVTLPFLIVSVVIVGVSFDFNLLNYAMIIVLPTLVCICMSFMGVLINLWLPLLEWDDETKVVKQSIAVLIAMFGGMFISMIPLILYYVFESLSIAVLFAISVMILVILTVVSVVLLFTIGVKRFQNI